MVGALELLPNLINLYVDLVNDEDAILVLESLPNLEYLNGHETREIQDNDEQDAQQQDALPQVNEIVESNTHSNERDADGAYEIEHVEQIVEHEHEEETNDNKLSEQHNSDNGVNEMEYINEHNTNNIIINSDCLNTNTNELNTAQQFNEQQHIDSLESEIPNFNVSIPTHIIHIIPVV